MPDPALGNPSGTGPLPGHDAGPPLLPGSHAPPHLPASRADVEDPSPGEPPAVPGGPTPPRTRDTEISPV